MAVDSGKITTGTTTATASATLKASAGGAAQSVIPKRLNESLWWESFVELLEQLESAPPYSDISDNLTDKLRRNNAWFLDTVSCFKPPNEASRLALESPEICLGSHSLVIKPELKEVAFRASKYLCLDEVQMYILVSMIFEHDNSIAVADGQKIQKLILLQYFIERQCLLKCVRLIFVKAICDSGKPHNNNEIKREALQLINDGLETRMLSAIKDLLSSVSSEKTFLDAEFMALWVDETIIENNLILDILFLAYYENFCVCNAVHWINLCSLFKNVLSGTYSIEKVAVSGEAQALFAHVKAQLLFILIETLDLENLLHMVNEEVPFSDGRPMFSMLDIQEINSLVSSLSILGMVECGPLLLAWAVFICLISSLPDMKNNLILMEIDHVDYVHQAFEVRPFNYLLEVLRSSCLRDSDGPVSGQLSILRTFVSAFIAAYEFSHQPEKDLLSLILEMLSEIYGGEESLSIQFWDRDSFVDGPIRSLLYMLESEYPYLTVEFVRFLSALCNGSWSAQCVYNFLDKMHGMTLLFEVPSGSFRTGIYDIVKAHYRIPVPGLDGVFIPLGARGQILKFVDDNIALVRWECAHSGVYVLFLRMAQLSHSSGQDDIFPILNLLYHLISSNLALCFKLLHLDESIYAHAAQNSGFLEMNVWVISLLGVRLIEDGRHVNAVAMCISLLAKMVECAPSLAIDSVLTSNIFGTANPKFSSGGLLFSGALFQILLADLWEEKECFVLTTSVLDYAIQHLEKGLWDTLSRSLVVFSLQYVFVNHMRLKFKLKCGHLKVTQKVLDLMKSCIRGVRISHMAGSLIWDILFFDSSVHNALFQLLLVAKQVLEKTYGYRLTQMKEIDGLQAAACSSMDIICSLLTDLSKESALNAMPFVQLLLPSMSKPISIFSATISLMSIFSHSAVQVAATKVLSRIWAIASGLRPYSLENIVLPDPLQVHDLALNICRILDEDLCKRDLLISVFDLLVSAAYFQPSILLPILSARVEAGSSVPAGDESKLTDSPIFYTSKCVGGSAIDLMLKYVRKSEVLISSDPHLLLSILNFFKALWDGGIQYNDALKMIRKSATFWEQLTAILAGEHIFDRSVKDCGSDDIQHASYRVKCQGIVLEIIAREIFILEGFSQTEICEKHILINSSKGPGQNGLSTKLSLYPAMFQQIDILSSWYEGSQFDVLMKSYASIAFDMEIIFNAKIASCVLIVHLMAVLLDGSVECLSMSLVEKISSFYVKMIENPNFSALVQQYSLRGYSEGKEVNRLVLNDLYYHLRGQLEGRMVTSGPCQELSIFLLDFEFFQCDECTHERDFLMTDVPLYDISSIRGELGIDLWDVSDLKKSKEIGDIMLSYMHTANLMMSFTNAKTYALKALVDVASLHIAKVLKSKSTLSKSVASESFIENGITHVCRCLQSTEKALLTVLNPPEKLVELFATQAEMLVLLSRILFVQYSCRSTKNFLPVLTILMRTLGSCLKLLAGLRISPMLNKSLKFLLMVLLMSLEYSYPKESINDSDLEVHQLTEVSVLAAGLLPVLCKCVENIECFDLSVASMDLLLKIVLPPDIWLHVLHSSIRLEHLIQIMRQQNCHVSVVVGLNFFLTMAQTKGGAEMLCSNNLLPSLKIFVSNLVDEEPNPDEACFSGYKDDKHMPLLGLGFAIIASAIQSLHDDSSVFDISDSTIREFVAEAKMIFDFVSAPNLPSDGQSIKKKRIQGSVTSMTALRLAEHSLSLICLLEGKQSHQRRGLQEIDLDLRQKSIRLLSFISKEAQHAGEPSHNKTIPFICLPSLKEEAESSKNPSFICSNHGWFMVSTLCLSSKARVSNAEKSEMSLVIRDKENGSTHARPTHLSDILAIQIYRIAALLLTFLCMQAKIVTDRAQEVGYIDLLCFPDLPMPDVLHGLQDQAIAIVLDVCETSKSRTMSTEAESVCLLMLQILEKSFYLEFFVIQSCDIRPVLGRADDISREIRSLIKEIKQHENLEPLLASLRQIILLLYPGLRQIVGYV